MIGLSVIVCVKNEAARLPACLTALKPFEEVIVVDSNSDDETVLMAQNVGVRVEPFTWDGQYPKKYQWTLDRLTLRHDRILFVDADEIVTQALCDEIMRLDWRCHGYFIKGRPVWKGQVLHHGLWNNKLALFDRRYFRFPDIDDLDIPGGNEMEGHYQPIATGTASIGQLRHPMLHDCAQGWQGRHEAYARWEAEMSLRRAFPHDPIPRREAMKKIFRAMPLRGAAMFSYGYLWKAGFLDGAAGFDYALAKGRYYRDIARARKALAQESVKSVRRIDEDKSRRRA